MEIYFCNNRKVFFIYISVFIGLRYSSWGQQLGQKSVRHNYLMRKKQWSRGFNPGPQKREASALPTALKERRLQFSIYVYVTANL